MNLLKTIRLLKGYTRKVVAEEIGVSHLAVINAESSENPNLNSKVLIKMLDFYGINHHKFVENFYSGNKKITLFVDSMLK